MKGLAVNMVLRDNDTLEEKYFESLASPNFARCYADAYLRLGHSENRAARQNFCTIVARRQTNVAP